LCPERAHALLLGLPIFAILDCTERLACARSGHNAAREIQADRLLGATCIASSPVPGAAATNDPMIFER
jgi:hypothetical protein